LACTWLFSSTRRAIAFFMMIEIEADDIGQFLLKPPVVG